MKPATPNQGTPQALAVGGCQKTKKINAIKELKAMGWKIGKKVICPDCIARKTMICRNCGSKLEKKQNVLICTNKNCRYLI